MKFQYMGKQRVGEASIDIDVTPGQEVPLLYRSPWVLTSKGSLRPG